MALRKDKIQALKDSLCLDNVDPATRSALNNLVDNLMDLFGDVAFPELGELPGIDAGEFGFPEDAPFDFPTGGGGMPAFDPLGGFEGGPPGGGDEFGPGGENGEQVQPVPCTELHPLVRDPSNTKHVTFLAKTEESIPAAENGNPGMGRVSRQELVPAAPEEIENCRKGCDDLYNELIDTKDREIRWLREELAGLDADSILREEYKARLDSLIEVKKITEAASVDCLINCENELDPDGPEDTEEQYAVKNISCEEIEKDTQVLVGGTISQVGDCEMIYDLYVIVEACGCD